MPPAPPRIEGALIANEICAPASHRHVVFPIPRLPRNTFKLDGPSGRRAPLRCPRGDSRLAPPKHHRTGWRAGPRRHRPDFWRLSVLAPPRARLGGHRRVFPQRQVPPRPARRLAGSRGTQAPHRPAPPARRQRPRRPAKRKIEKLALQWLLRRRRRRPSCRRRCRRPPPRRLAMADLASLGCRPLTLPALRQLAAAHRYRLGESRDCCHPRVHVSLPPARSAHRRGSAQA